MIIVNKNDGEKISYEINECEICFGDLTIDLAKYEEDCPTHIDICFDENDTLIIGTDLGKRYVAEIDIPARQYIETDENYVSLPLDMDKIKLSLWSIGKEN